MYIPLFHPFPSVANVKVTSLYIVPLIRYWLGSAAPSRFPSRPSCNTAELLLNQAEMLSVDGTCILDFLIHFYLLVMVVHHHAR